MTNHLAAPLLALAAAFASASPAAAQEPTRGADRVDAESTRLLREHTTDPSFLTEWVDYVPESATVPSPRDFLGYVIGTPGELTPPERIIAYFRALDAASDRLELVSLGFSHGDREMVMALIADPEVLARKDAIRDANQRLADPRATDADAARALARTTPATYMITAGLHSPELGPPEMVMELAYRLVVSEAEHVREIRANLLTLLCPVLEMDGRARTVDWHRRYLSEVDQLDDTPPRSPPYWGDYTFHDNNRDGLQQSQPLTRNYTDAFYAWKPAVSLDLHESVPLLYVSMGTGPYNETIDPITVAEWQWMATWDVTRATQLGLRGVWTWGFYTGWYPGYLLWVTNNHNAAGRFYETYGNHVAATVERDLEDARYADQRIETRQWYRPWPPEKRLRWSMRNNTNYMQTGVLASLQLAARNGDTLLENFWQKGANALEKGRTEPPFAYHVPLEQSDRASLEHLLWLLDRHAIEVHRATADAEVGDGHAIAEGDFVVRMDQPYRNFARTLLQPSRFPETAELQPYDDVAWSLDLMLGLDVHPVDDEAVLTAELEPVAEPPRLAGRFEEAERWIVDHRAQVRLASLRWALGDADVVALASEWQGHPAGSLVIEGVSSERMRWLAREHRVDALAVDGRPDDVLEVELPRVALFHTWTYTQDSGWARFTLEELELPYELIDKDDLRAGALGERFDVVVVPDQRRSSFARIVHGVDPKWGPMPYARTDDYPSHGVIDSTDDLTGGMGFEGLAELHAFVREGGLLITLGDAGVLAAEGGIARSVSTEPAGGTPGSHVTAKLLRPEHPVAFGYDPVTHVFHGNTRRFRVPEHRLGTVVAQYGTRTLAEAERAADRAAGIPVDDAEPADGGDPSAERPLCLSGVVRDPSALERAPAVLDVPVGEGRVLLFTWNPLHRHQNHHDVSFFTNALLFFDDFPPTPTEVEMRRREAQPAASAAEAEDAGAIEAAAGPGGH